MTRPVQAILVQHAVALLRPLTDAAGDTQARDRLLRGMGWDLSALAGFDLPAFVDALVRCRDTVARVAARIDAGLDDLGDAAWCLTEIRTAVTAVVDLFDGWRPPPAPGAPGRPAPPHQDADPYRLFLTDLFSYLLDAHLALYAPNLRVALDVLGVRRLVTATAPVTIGGRQARDRRERPYFTVDPVGRLLVDPVGVLRDRLFGPEGPPTLPAEIADALGEPLVRWLTGVGVPASYGTPGVDAAESGLSPAQRDAARRLLHLSWSAPVGAPDETGTDPVGDPLGQATLHLAAGLARDTTQDALDPPLALVLAPQGTLDATVEYGQWTLQSRLTGLVTPVVVTRDGVRFRPADGSTPPAGAELTGSVELRYASPTPGEPALRLGAPDATRLEVDQLRFTAQGRLTATGPTGDLVLSLDGARLLIAPGDDGFLAAVLPPYPIRIDLDAGLRWSPEHGLTLTAGGGLELALPVGASFGPLHVEHVTAGVRAGSTGLPGGGATGPVSTAGAEVRLTTDLTVRLGPVTASATGLGVRAALTPADGAGSLGPIDVDLAFLRPSGIGIAVDAGIVTGGGFLLAQDDGRYGGVVQLNFLDQALSAVGLLDTRMPDGSPGFSLLVLISVRFPPVQLGFGFALTGVGGLIGVNRAVRAQAMRDGLADGGLDGLLFPADPIGNAPRLIRDLDRFFPTTVGQHVVGPTVELTWGAQGLLTARLGLFVQFPTPVRVVLAGQLRIALPPGRTEPVALIQVDLVGTLDFGQRTVAIDGVLRDSRLAGFTLTGRMAVRANWGDRPSFLVSIGGFHPRYPQPDTVPVLSRLTLSLGDGNPRLRLASYLAITSNTVQFGARLDLYAGISVPLVGTFAIAAVLSFDALIVLEPLSFAIDIYAMVALTWNGDPVLAVELAGSLTGPRPWRAVGRASFTFLGRHSIRFDVTVGRRAVNPPPLRVNLAERIRAALADPANWTAEPPTGTGPLVTLAESAIAGTEVLVHPLGSLTVRQKVAPLEVTVDRYGTAALAGDVRRFTLGAVTLDGVPARSTPVDDLFPPAEYLDLDDMEKLSAPSFERWPSGFRVDDSALTLPPEPAWRLVAARTEDEVVTRTPDSGSTGQTVTRPIPDDRMKVQAGAGAAAVNGAGAQGVRAFAGPAGDISLAEPLYAVVTATPPTDGALAVLTPARPPARFAQAREALAAQGAGGVRKLIENDDVPRE
ncbi:DUF6603 domain-containing protein [Verrucosispora sp. FIM060022]|uniref:DUF6603 domain-containing protein n=1 Tax=Verrucosispora sp. FIM060022 TaxID=1479020 RepID=UPI000F88E522|nr:DUF6603 domain-containing protein [Verrucosispora sp. FIM060022]RUL95142.1 hypothetical protein EG812_05710 [Verrucosispora sp. FIM060022]